MAITRTAWIDDDGSGTTGTVINNAEKTLLYDQIDAALGVTANKYDTVTALQTATGTVNNWAPGLNGHTFTEWSAAADLIITGVTAQSPGQRWTFKNVGTAVAYLAHQNGGSTAANRFRNVASSASTPVAPGGWATYVNDGASWWMIAHDQGAFITPPYSSADFSPNTGVWTVEAGDVSTYYYRLAGRMLTVSWYLQSTQTSGAPGVLRVKIPGGFTATKASLHPAVHDDGGNAGTFCLIAGPSSTTIDTYWKYGTGSFSTSSAIRAFGTVTFEVN